MMELDDIASALGLDAESRWFRGSLSRGIELREGQPTVDREKGIICGYSVITQGPALGHDMEIDATTLDQVVSYGNKAKAGIKSRFDHPNASNTSMGTFLGRTKHFRKMGNQVLADLHLSESAKEAPQGDLYSYVLGLAERDPAAFGASIVFSGKAEAQLNDDGTQKKDATGRPLPKLARIEQLLASDVVDDPAANPNGLFDRGDSLATKITAFLNRWAQHDLVPALLARLAAPKEDASMAPEQQPQSVSLSQADLDKAAAKGISDERARVSGIMKAFAAVWGEQATADERTVRDGFIELGTSVEEADRHFKTRKLAQITAAAPSSVGGPTDPAPAPALSGEAKWKADWEHTPELRQEFGGKFEAYQAFMQRQEAAA